MRRFLLVIGVLLLSWNALAVATRYEYYDGNNDGGILIYGDNYDGQSFTVGTVGPNANFDLTSVKCLLYRKGVVGTVTFEVFAVDVNGLPTGSALSSGTTDGDTLPTGSPYEWREIEMTSVELSASTKYALVAHKVDGNTQNWCGWRYINNASAYTGGTGVGSSDGGVEWFASTGIDYDFEVYGLRHPDVNIWQVNGYDLNAALPAFSYSADGNLSTKFRVSDTTSNDLNFNMWYDTVANGKTNKIVGDINLSTDLSYGKCDTNATTGMVCQWDWNISGIADNNYWITIEINNKIDSNTVTTEKSFRVNPSSVATTIQNADANNIWQNTDANILFKCSGSCKNFFYSLDDTNYQKGWGADLNIGVVLATDLNHKILYWSSNTSDENEAINLIYLAIDKTAPVTDHNAFNSDTNWFNSDLNVNLHCTDASAGCRKLFYSVNDTNYEAGWGIDQNVGISITADGNHLIFFRSDDNSFGVGDNNEAVVYLNIGLDKTAPATSFALSGSAVTLACSDATSGCKTTGYSLDGAGWVSGTSIGGLSEGTHSIDYNSIDVAGNNEALQTKAFTVGTSGGGGGGGETPPDQIEVTVPALVNIYPSAREIRLSPGQRVEYKIVVESLSDTDMPLDIVPSQNLLPYLIAGAKQEWLPAKSSVVWKWLFYIPEGASLVEDVNGAMVVKVAEQEEIPIELVLQPYVFDVFSIELNGIPVVWIAAAVCLLVFAYYAISPKKQKKKGLYKD